MPALGKQRQKDLEFKVMVPELHSEALFKKKNAKDYLCVYLISCQIFYIVGVY